PSIYFLSFFLISLLHPTSTLFPYTTLFRSLERNRDFQQTIAACVPLSFTYDPKVSSFETWMRRFVPYREAATRWVHRAALSGTRSEEHTSELQSPDHLVCRLLLEKKKKKTN